MTAVASARPAEGGPTYAGAMACHYLDLLLLAAAAAWLLGRILPAEDRAAAAAPAGEDPGGSVA